MKKTNLQGVICLAVFFLFANHAWAEEWILYATPNTGKMYYEKNSIKKINEKIISVWTKIIFNDDGKIKAFSYLKSMNNPLENPDILAFESRLQEIDCINKKIKITASSIYDKKNNVVFSLPVNIYGEWQEIIPKSANENLKNIVSGAGKTSPPKKK